MRRAFVLAAGLLLVPPFMARAQEKEKPKQEDPLAAELASLEASYKQAMEEFYAPLKKAKTDEERAKVTIDWSKQPAKAFLPKFQDLAKRAKGTDVALSALTWIVENPVGSSEATHDAVDEIVASHVESPKLERVVGRIRYVSTGPAAQDRTAKALRTILEKSPHKKVKAAATFALAQRLLEHQSGNGSKEEGRKLFESLEKDYKDTGYAAQAKGYLYELDHLQVGMVAPDFEATDQDGAKLKLSDYRGKVLVLDFWGFW